MSTGLDTTLCSERWEGDGGVMNAPFPYKVSADDGSDLVVIRTVDNGDGTTTDTLLTADVHYAVTVPEDRMGATVQYPRTGSGEANLEEGDYLTVLRRPSKVMGAHFRARGPLSMALLQEDMERIVMMVQDLQEQVTRRPGYPDSTPLGDVPDVSTFMEQVDGVEANRVAAQTAQGLAEDASEAAQGAAAKVPDFGAGDADAFLTVKADESGGEYVGGDDARAKLGLGGMAVQNKINNGDWEGDDLDVTNGGTGASTAAEARSNLGLGPVAVQDALTAHRYVYVSQDGSDDTGDGSSESPYQTVNKALDFLDGLLITTGSYATIRVRGYLENHPTIEVLRKNQGLVAVYGEHTPTGHYATSYAVSGAGTDLEVAFATSVACAAECTVGNYAIVEDVDASYDAEDIKLTGCWKITAIDAVNGIVTLLVKDYSAGTAPGTGAPCTIVPMRDGIRFAPGVHGIEAVYSNTDLGQIANIVLAGGDGDDPALSSRYAVFLLVGSRAWLNGRVGITGWHTGILNSTGVVDANDARISNCQTGAYSEGGLFRAANIQITGCSSRGFRGQYSTQNMLHGSGKVIAGNGTGVYAYYGAFVIATNGAVDHNGDNFQPNPQIVGNANSYIFA